MQKPRAAVDLNRHNAVVLARRMVDTAGVALILFTEQAARISGRRKVARRRDGLGVLFRFGQVDRDVQLPVPGRRFPLHVFCNAVTADIIGILRKFIIPIGRGPRTLGVQRLEPADNLARARGQLAHEHSVKQIAVHDAVLRQHAARMRVIHEFVQDCRKVNPRWFFSTIGITVQFQRFQQGVYYEHPVFRLDEAGSQAVGHQLFDRKVHAHAHAS